MNPNLTTYAAWALLIAAPATISYWTFAIILGPEAAILASLGALTTPMVWTAFFRLKFTWQPFWSKQWWSLSDEAIEIGEAT